jgi:hypothetical protein
MKGLGYFLGATLGAGVLFFVISFIFLQPRKVSDLLITGYLRNSSKIVIKNVPLITSFDTPVPDERLGRGVISKLTFFSNRNMSYVRADTYTYFCKELNKYVKTYMINEGGGMNSNLLDFGRKNKDGAIWPDIYVYYNKIQNEDPSYGTIEKPLPILHFRSADPAVRSMRQDNKDSDAQYLKMVYDENVKLYLQYFIDKKDFQKLFPDS